MHLVRATKTFALHRAICLSELFFGSRWRRLELPSSQGRANISSRASPAQPIFPHDRGSRPSAGEPPSACIQPTLPPVPAFVRLPLPTGTRKRGGCTLRTRASQSPPGFRFGRLLASADWLLGTRWSRGICAHRRAGGRAGTGTCFWRPGRVSSPCCRVVSCSRDLRAQQHDVCLGELHQPYPRAAAQAAAGRGGGGDPGRRGGLGVRDRRWGHPDRPGPFSPGTASLQGAFGWIAADPLGLVRASVGNKLDRFSQGLRLARGSHA